MDGEVCPLFFPEGQRSVDSISEVHVDGEACPLAFHEGQRVNSKQTHWHSVFGLCSCSKMSSFLKLRTQVVKHRRKVNGLIKLEKYVDSWQGRPIGCRIFEWRHA